MADSKVLLPDVRVSKDEISAIAETYRCAWLSMGPETERFEAAFARHSGVRHAFATAKGTASLQLRLAASGLGPATVNSVAYAGATPNLCDIGELLRPWITGELVEPLLGPRTKAILTMPYGGQQEASASARVRWSSPMMTLSRAGSACPGLTA
jgi:perosamine synthetase